MDPMERLTASFSEDMDKVRRCAEERDVPLLDVALAYKEITSHSPPMASEGDIEDAVTNPENAQDAARVLVDTGDVHMSTDEDYEYWYIQCSEFIAEQCNSKRISLKRYFDMLPILRDFQDECIRWHLRRNRRLGHEKTLTELKEEYVHRIQENYFEDKPVETEGDRTWSRHIAARYVKAAMDSIRRSLDLTQ